MLSSTLNSNFLKSLIWSAFLVFFSFAMQYSSSIVSLMVDEDNSVFQPLSETEWITSTGSLKNGVYFITVGRPKAVCDILANEKVLVTNKSGIPEVRTSLMLGTAITVSTNYHPIIKIRCVSQQGFSPRLTHVPILARYRIGLFIHLWRMITQLFLGPVTAFVLLLIVLLNFIFSKVHSQFDPKTYFVETHTKSLSLGRTWPFIIFGIVSFLYAVSSTHFPSLFIGGIVAACLHIILRHSFALGFLCIAGHYSKFNRLALLVHVLSSATAFFLAWVYPSQLNAFYRFSYILFPLTTALATRTLFQVGDKSKSVIWLRSLSIAWTILQCFDLVVLYTSWSREYLSPSFILFLVLSVSYFNIQDRKQSEKIQSAYRKILALIESKIALEELIPRLATLTYQENLFTRVSAYVDGYVVGRTEKPHEELHQVLAHGYKKSTSKDLVLKKQHGRGEFLFQDLENGEVTLRKGKSDNAWFIIVPIGKHVCITLSDDKPRDECSSYENLALMQQLHPALKTLEPKIIDRSLKSSIALDKLRLIFGEGHSRQQLGAIIADINHYSKYVSRYGEPFVDFVREKYFPALIRNVSQWATVERIVGDEIAFLTVKDLVDSNFSIEAATANALIAIRRFIDDAGAELCRENGYPALELQGGADIGVVNIVCTPYLVECSGPPLITAARLTKAASTDQFLISDNVQIDSKYDIAVGERITVRVKKDLLNARPFSIRETPRKISGLAFES